MQSNPLVVAVFALVYAGMALGRLPGFALDRSGIALLGAIALVAGGSLSPEQAWAAVDVPTMVLLFSLMVVSAQLQLSGFYEALTARLAAARLSPRALLALVVAVVGLLSAVLVNDIVCLMMTPILAAGCARRGLDPLPFLLALACAANVGSAITLIGNPQNMLVGEALHLSFGGYLLHAGLPVGIAGLFAVWSVVCWRVRGVWHAQVVTPQPDAHPLEAWQAVKGVAVMAALLAAFLLTSWPRDVLALGAAGVLLLSRRMASRHLVERVDGHVLLLFAGLFIVNRALESSGLLAQATAWVETRGFDPSHPVALFGATVVLSNLVSNVPAVMLLLPVAHHRDAGPILALASTLAGNLFLMGSIANLIVVERARAVGVRVTWTDHARVGVPVTLVTLLIAAAWLALPALQG